MLRKLVIVFVYSALMLMALEALLRIVPLPDPRSAASHRVHLFLPGWNTWIDWLGAEPPFERTFATGPLVGVSTTSVVVKVNRFGFLYDEQKADRQSTEELRIGVVGGSTVECSALEAGKRWPDVLEGLLRQQVGGRAVTVLNLGVSGTDSRTYVATVAQHAVKLDLNYLVFLLGANDLFRANSADDPLLRADAFQSDEPFALRSLLLRFQLPRRLRVLFNRLRGTEYYVASAGVDRPYFAARVGEVHRLPLLPGAKVTISAEALSDYEANIVSLSWLASAHGITPIFATQPMLWKSGMSASEEAVDWLAGTVVSDGSRYRVPSAEQARALESLNHRLLETCVRKHLKCLDLEKEIPRSTDAFYDSLHFNEAGAAMVAGHVARYVAREQ